MKSTNGPSEKLTSKEKVSLQLPKAAINLEVIKVQLSLTVAS